MKIIDFMTAENQKKVCRLNLIAQSSKIQIVDKNNDLLLDGFLKIIAAKNAAQAYFLNDKSCIVELSKKGSEFILKAPA